ncbi:MAG: hypothetical protein ABI663_17385 [Chryseolinea sp.]
MNLKPYSSIVLSISGLLLVGMGLYFLFIRPPLLLEDTRYMSSTMQNVNENIPGLLKWLPKVFWVMGSYILTTGLLTVFISFTSFRNRTPGSFSIVSLTGITSIGSMTVVNFVINSDFKWVLLTFSLPWVIALILYRLHK